MRGSVTVRQLCPTDSFEHLTKLLHRAYARLAESGWNATASYQSVDVTRARSGEGVCFVAEIDGTIVGTATVVLEAVGRGPELYRCSEVAMLGQFGVDPDWKGNNIGRLLMAACERTAVENGKSTIALDTVASNEELVAYYFANGYFQSGHHQWPGKTYRSVVLAKNLTEVE